MNRSVKVFRKRILLADDQPDVRAAVRLLLDIDGHTVTEAASGEEALELFAPNRFDLVIIDYRLPVMRGDEVATNIKRVAPFQPILMITGSDERSAGFAPSVDALLPKPFMFEELRGAVAELLC